MTQYYSDPTRESDPHALPDVEVFYLRAGEMPREDDEPNEAGFYWWSCFPGCLPDGDAIGPFATEEAALADAREGVES